MCFVAFFFFKQKTAYEMRISDWSSDVCSSDLPGAQRGRAPAGRRLVSGRGGACRDRKQGAGCRMITRDPRGFLDFSRGCAPDFGPATATAAFLVSPDGFARPDESASDNRYMADAAGLAATLAGDWTRNRINNN